MESKDTDRQSQTRVLERRPGQGPGNWVRKLGVGGKDSVTRNGSEKGKDQVRDFNTTN